MARRFTSGFEILSMSEDPTPGDPDQIEALAGRYEDIRDQAGIAVRVLRAGGELDAGRGEAIEKLREILKEVPVKLQSTVDSFGAAADAYRVYARELRDQQATVDQAMSEAEPVAALAGRTQAPLPADATDQQRADAQAVSDQIGAAQQTLTRARQLAEEARSLRERSTATAANALDEAAAKAIEPRSFLQKIGDYFADHPFIQIIIDLIIAAIAVFFPVVGILLGLASLAFTFAIENANGNVKLGTLLFGLLALVPGGKLLGALGKIGNLGSKLAQFGTKLGKIGGAAEKFGQISQSFPKVVKGGKAVGALAFDFGKGAAQDAAATALNGESLDAGQILAGAAAGAGAGALIGRATQAAGERFRASGTPKPAGAPGAGGAQTAPSGGASSTGARSIPAPAANSVAPPADAPRSDTLPRPGSAGGVGSGGLGRADSAPAGFGGGPAHAAPVAASDGGGVGSGGLGRADSAPVGFGGGPAHAAPTAGGGGAHAAPTAGAAHAAPAAGPAHAAPTSASPHGDQSLNSPATSAGGQPGNATSASAGTGQSTGGEAGGGRLDRAADALRESGSFGAGTGAKEGVAQQEDAESPVLGEAEGFAGKAGGVGRDGAVDSVASIIHKIRR